MSHLIVTKKELKAIQKKFKNGYRGQYVIDLIDAMNKRKKELRRKKAYDKQAIYNVFNGAIKNEFVKRAILEESCKLYKIYTGEDYLLPDATNGTSTSKQ